MQMRLTAAAAAAAIVVLGAHANAQLQPIAPPPNFDAVVIKTRDLGNQTYMLEGEGGNITVAVADDGVIRWTASSRRCTARSRPPSRR